MNSQIRRNLTDPIAVLSVRADDAFSRATAGLARAPEFLTSDWVLAQFGKSRPTAQKRYREWEELRGQIYLRCEEFVEEHSAKNLALKAVRSRRLDVKG